MIHLARTAGVHDAALNMSFTEVRAPITGRVGRALLTVGNLARADDTLITTVVSQDPVYIYFDCDEQSVLRYNSSRTSSQGLPIVDATVHVSLANERGFPHEGVVDFLDNTLNATTGTIRARVRMRNADHIFIPGMYARVRLSTRREKAILLDDKAVLTDQDRKFAYVIGPQNHALRRDVTAVRVIGGRRVIESGLEAGDRVVVDGLQKIFYPGAVVQPVDPAGKSPGVTPDQSTR
jgi:membrane fusion protein, multidrug efflux system